MSRPTEQVDPRDLFIKSNPTGLATEELEMGRSGFVDFRTHSDYLIFLAGYEANAEASQIDNNPGHRDQVNAEGCKPEISIQPDSSLAAAGSVAHVLNKAEGDQPDLNTSTPGADEPALATPQPDKAQLCGWIKCSDRLPEDHLDGLGVIVAVVTAKGERISELDVWNKGRHSGRFEFWGKKVSHWQPLPAAPGGQQ